MYRGYTREILHRSKLSMSLVNRVALLYSTGEKKTKNYFQSM
jgi:hypothetical protein